MWKWSGPDCRGQSCPGDAPTGCPYKLGSPATLAGGGEAALLLLSKCSTKNPAKTSGEAGKALPAGAVLVKSQWEGSILQGSHLQPSLRPGAGDSAQQSTEQPAACDPSPCDLPQSILKVNTRPSRSGLSLAGNLMLPAPHEVQQKPQTQAQRSHNSSWPIRQALKDSLCSDTSQPLELFWCWEGVSRLGRAVKFLS